MPTMSTVAALVMTDPNVRGALCMLERVETGAAVQFVLETADDEVDRPAKRIPEDDDEQNLQAGFEGPRCNRLKVKSRPMALRA